MPPGDPARRKAHPINDGFEGHLIVPPVRYPSPTDPPLANSRPSPPPGPPAVLVRDRQFKALPVDSKAEREFHEGIARDLLVRDGIAIVWRLHLNATKAYHDAYPLGAEVLIKVADAAERLLLHEREAALTRRTP